MSLKYNNASSRPTIGTSVIFCSTSAVDWINFALLTLFRIPSGPISRQLSYRPARSQYCHHQLPSFEVYPRFSAAVTRFCPASQFLSR